MAVIGYACGDCVDLDHADLTLTAVHAGYLFHSEYSFGAIDHYVAGSCCYVASILLPSCRYLPLARGPVVRYLQVVVVLLVANPR